MAYYDPNEDPLNPNAPQGSDTGPQSGVISGQGSTPTQTNTPSTPAPDKPGNFVGIQQYLDQNKPQSAKLASDVGSYVQGQGEAAKTALNEGQGQFDQAVGQGTVKLNDDLFKQAKETPEQVDADQTKKTEFQKMRDAQYQGPSSLETSDYYQPINLAIQNALGTANKTQTASGRSELLADIQKQKGERVSRGAANLDAGLLSASPDSRTILSQARDQITPLQDQMKAVSEAESMKAKAAADQTAKTQAAIHTAFSGPTGVQGQLESDLQNRAQVAATQAGTSANDLMARLKAGAQNLSDQDLNVMGITRHQYNNLLADQAYYRDRGQASPLSDLSSFGTVQAPGNLITPQNIATSEDYARYQALNDLMGTSNQFLNDPSQAGKANPDALNFRYNDTPNVLFDRVHQLSFKPAGYEGYPRTFDAINDSYNAAKNPRGAADLAVDIAQTDKRQSRTPNNRIIGTQAAGVSDLLEKTTDALGSINKAYGLNLTLPPEYYNQAMKAIRDNMLTAYNQFPADQTGFNVVPNEEQIQRAAKTSGMITYLNDLAKDISKVRG